MLTLFTGIPGAGKTCAGLDLVLDLLKGGDRPLYVLEVPEENVAPLNLKIPHTLLGDFESASRWHEVVPNGAVVFVSEAQRLWPARSPSSKVPAHVEALGQHRKRGIDIVIDSQGPKLLDDKVRLRVGRHVHLRDLGVLGRHWYEWPECGDPGAWRSAPIKVRYRLPRRTFELFTSASLHVKPVRKIPPVLFLLGLLIPALLFLTYRIYSSISSKNEVKPAAAAQASPFAGGHVQRSQPLPIGPAELVASATPRIADDPRTAPLYDQLRHPVRMPRIMGGWCRAGTCTCYADDAQKAAISPGACARWVADPPFDAYHQPELFTQDRMLGGSRAAGTSAAVPGAGGAAPSEPRSGVALPKTS